MKNMKFRLTQDVYSQTIDLTGHARSEGWLPAGTVVQPVQASPDVSPWTQQHRGNRGEGILVRIITQANGADGAGCARELLQGIDSINAVAERIPWNAPEAV